jgi:hypothetical protein
MKGPSNSPTAHASHRHLTIVYPSKQRFDCLGAGQDGPLSGRETISASPIVLGDTAMGDALPKQLNLDVLMQTRVDDVLMHICAHVLGMAYKWPPLALPTCLLPNTTHLDSSRSQHQIPTPCPCTRALSLTVYQPPVASILPLCALSTLELLELAHGRSKRHCDSSLALPHAGSCSCHARWSQTLSLTRAERRLQTRISSLCEAPSLRQY